MEGGSGALGRTPGPGHKLPHTLLERRRVDVAGQVGPGAFEVVCWEFLAFEPGARRDVVEESPGLRAERGHNIWFIPTPVDARRAGSIAHRPPEISLSAGRRQSGRTPCTEPGEFSAALEPLPLLLWLLI